MFTDNGYSGAMPIVGHAEENVNSADEYITYLDGVSDNNAATTVTQVLYVDGIGSGTKDGSSKENALATLGEAYAKVPADNEETIIVICGTVNAKEGATLKSGAYHFPTSGGNSHTGKVIITSVYGELEGAGDYRASSGLAFGANKYYFLGDTTFRNIKITEAADRICADYYPMHLGSGIEGTVTKNLYMGTNSDFSGLCNVKDVALTIDSGKVGTVYGGGYSYQGATARGKDNTVTININGGEITTLYGSGDGNTDNAHHKSVTINVNGGTITTLSGAHETGTVYGDVKIALNGGTVTTVYGARKYNAETWHNKNYTPTIYGDVEIEVGDTVVTNLYGMAEGSNVVGNRIMHYNGRENASVVSSSLFDVMKITSSSVTVPTDLSNIWADIEEVRITDDSVLNLAASPSDELTEKIAVKAIKANIDWNMSNAIIKAPAGTQDIFELMSPLSKKLEYISEENQVTWKLADADMNIGQAGQAGAVLNIDLGLPEANEFTPLSEDATPYEVFLQKVEDLGDAKEEVNVIEPVEVRGEYEIYVSPTGNDANNGSKETPLKTIDKALDYVQILQEDLTEVNGPKGIVVYLREGNYEATESIVLSEVHSSTNGIPVIISSYNNEEVIISGGKEIAGSAFTEITDETILSRLQDKVKDKIVSVDLKTLGITEFGSISTKGPLTQIFVDGEQFILARYPNVTNLALTGEVLDIGQITADYSDLGGQNTNMNSTGIEFEMSDLRPKSWTFTNDIYLMGSVYAEWHVENLRVKEIRENSIKLDRGSTLGARSDPSNTYYYYYYYYYNVLEELDVPGEYYLDMTNGILYLYPIGDMTNSVVTYSAMQEDLICLNGTKNVILNGLIIENGAASGISMKGCEQTVVQNCVIRNVGTGVLIDGKKSGVIYSKIYNTAKYSGEMSSWQVAFDYNPECNFLQNCYIYNTGTQNGKLSPFMLWGTGNVVSHNLFQGTHAASIYIRGAKECIVEYNEIVGGPTGLKDMAAIYMPYLTSATGNHVRYNYIHDIGGFSNSSNPSAIYFDEGMSGHYAYGNIIKNVPCGFYTNSGSENVIVNNVVLDGRSATQYAIRAENNFGKLTIAERIARASGIRSSMEQYLAMSTDEQTEIKSRYPLLAKFYEDLKSTIDSHGETYVGFFTTHDNYVANNLIYDCGNSVGSNFPGKNQVIGTNSIYTVEDGNPFTDIEHHDYSLKNGVTTNFTYKIPSMNDIGVLGEKNSISDFKAYLPNDGSQKEDPRQILLKWTLADGADTYSLTLATDEALTQPFDATQYQDEYQARLKDAIMKKIQGQEIVVADTGAPDNVIDLMEALKKSLEQTKGSPKGRKKAGTA